MDIVNVDGTEGESISDVHTTGGAHLSQPSLSMAFKTQPVHVIVGTWKFFKML